MAAKMILSCLMACVGIASVLGSEDDFSAPSGVTDVTISFTLLSVVKTDSENGFVEMVMYENLNWRDTRLIERAESTSAVRMSSIWAPDIVMYNDLYSVPQYNREVPAALVPGGGVALVRPFTRRVPCVKDESGLVCELKFGSWTQSKASVNPVIGSPAVDTTFFKHPKFEVASSDAKIVSLFPDYPMAVFTVTLKKTKN